MDLRSGAPFYPNIHKISFCIVDPKDKTKSHYRNSHKNINENNFLLWSRPLLWRNIWKKLKDLPKEQRKLVIQYRVLYSKNKVEESTRVRHDHDRFNLNQKPVKRV